MMYRKNLILTMVLILAGFFIYSFNLNNSLFWDDDEWIRGNVFVHSFSYLKEIFTQNVEAGFGLNSNYYRPILLLSFVFNYVIHGIAPFGYHFVSNGFHIANGILIFVLLGNFIGLRASFIASLLFLIHPAQTEAVSYISGRGDPMSVFFMLLAFWFFIKSLNIKTFKSKIYKVLSFFSAILALLSRETAVLFPLLLMIFYISFLSKDGFMRSFKASFLKSLPFWIISAIYFVLRLTVFNFENTLNFYSEPTIYSENLLYRLFTFGHVLIEYFKIILWPAGLHMERDLPVATSIFQWPAWFGILIAVGIMVVGIILYRKENSKSQIQNVSDSRMWTFGWFWFFVALGPVSGIIPINALIYEHWLYLPLIGFAAFVGFYLDKAFEFLESRSVISRKLLLLGLIVYFSFFSFQSIRRNILWGKPIEFYEDILKYNSLSVRIMTNLGKQYFEKRDFAKAAEFYERAVESPGGDIFAQPHYNLGNLYRDTGRINEAIKQYEEAIKIDPTFPFAYQNLAEIYVNKKQDFISGIEILEKLKKVQPGNPRVFYNLGLLYLATDSVDLAIRNFELGLDLVSGQDMEVEAAISEILNKIKIR